MGINKIETRTVGSDDSGQRLDRWLRRSFGRLPQSKIEGLCRKGMIRIGDARAKPSDRLQEGQTVRLPVSLDFAPRNDPSQGFEQSIKIPPWFQSAILYQDSDIIVFDKPPGIAVQGGTSQRRHLAGYATACFATKDSTPKLIHRLDKETSGLLVMARNRRAASALSEDFRLRRVTKLYLAIVHGCPKVTRGCIESEMWVQETDKTQTALTNYEVIDGLGQKLALVALKPLTGRNHQLRIHLADMGHPIVGDRQYGQRIHDGSLHSGRRMMLHAGLLEFSHPGNGKTRRFHAPLPPHMRRRFQLLGWDDKQLDFGTLAECHA